MKYLYEKEDLGTNFVGVSSWNCIGLSDYYSDLHYFSYRILFAMCSPIGRTYGQPALCCNLTNYLVWIAWFRFFCHFYHLATGSLEYFPADRNLFLTCFLHYSTDCLFRKLDGTHSNGGYLLFRCFLCYFSFNMAHPILALEEKY